MTARLAVARVYGILDLGYVAPGATVAMARRLLAPGGVDVLQFRAKDRGPAEIASLARPIVPMAREAGIPFLINDFPDVAVEIGADGVHVGQDDLPVSEIRRIVGPEGIVGKSTHSLDQARRAGGEPVDYIGVGPIFATPTKPDYAPVGPTDIATVVREVPVPVFCIGGIKRENLAEVLAAGATRVVIVSGLLLAGEDLPEYLRAVRAELAGAAGRDRAGDQSQES